MWEVDGGYDERYEGVATVVLCVGEDGEVGLEECHLCTAMSEEFLFDCIFGADIPTSPATSLSRPEKTRSQSLNSSGLHVLTTSSPSSFDMGNACFHLTASLYFLPADRSEAPTACSVKWG